MIISKIILIEQLLCNRAFSATKNNRVEIIFQNRALNRERDTDRIHHFSK